MAAGLQKQSGGLLFEAAMNRVYDLTGDEIRLRIRLSPGARKEALGGLWAAWLLDTPAGPSIVCVAAVLFLLTTALGALRRG